MGCAKSRECACLNNYGYTDRCNVFNLFLFLEASSEGESMEEANDSDDDDDDAAPEPKRPKSET